MAEFDYKQYIYAQIFCYSTLFEGMDRVELQSKLHETLIVGTEDTSIMAFMDEIIKKQQDGTIIHIPEVFNDPKNKMTPAEIIFGEIVRELLTTCSMTFFSAGVRNYLIDFMLTCEFEVPKSQLLLIVAHIVCICIILPSED